MQSKQKLPRFAREIIIPRGVVPKADLVRALTRQMERLATHFRGNPKHWRSYGAKEALRMKHQQRADVLHALQQQAPSVYAALVAELNLEQRRIST